LYFHKNQQEKTAVFKQLGLKSKSIIFVRHGQSIGNVRGLDDESLVDTPNYLFGISEQGQFESRQAGEILRNLKLSWDQSFISTYLRTKQTWDGMKSVFPTGLAEPIIDSRLNEWWRGIWHTMNKDDIVKYFPLEFGISKREGWYHYRAPGGQAGQDVELQIYSFLTDFVSGTYSDAKTILVVGHGKWAILFWRIMTGATVDEAEEKLKNNPFGNCSITICDKNGLETINNC